MDILEQTINTLEAKYGEVFGLRAFPREKFCISRGASYVVEVADDKPPRVMIYTFRWDDDRKAWLAFSKGALGECQPCLAVIVPPEGIDHHTGRLIICHFHDVGSAA